MFCLFEWRPHRPLAPPGAQACRVATASIAALPFTGCRITPAFAFPPLRIFLLTALADPLFLIGAAGLRVALQGGVNRQQPSSNVHSHIPCQHNIAFTLLPINYMFISCIFVILRKGVMLSSDKKGETDMQTALSPTTSAPRQSRIHHCSFLGTGLYSGFGFAMYMNIYIYI